MDSPLVMFQFTTMLYLFRRCCGAGCFAQPIQRLLQKLRSLFCYTRLSRLNTRLCLFCRQSIKLLSPGSYKVSSIISLRVLRPLPIFILLLILNSTLCHSTIYWLWPFQTISHPSYVVLAYRMFCVLPLTELTLKFELTLFIGDSTTLIKLMLGCTTTTLRGRAVIMAPFIDSAPCASGPSLCTSL